MDQKLKLFSPKHFPIQSKLTSQTSMKVLKFYKNSENDLKIKKFFLILMVSPLNNNFFTYRETTVFSGVRGGIVFRFFDLQNKYLQKQKTPRI